MGPTTEDSFLTSDNFIKNEQLICPFFFLFTIEKLLQMNPPSPFYEIIILSYTGVAETSIYFLPLRVGILAYIFHEVTDPSLV